MKPNYHIDIKGFDDHIEMYIHGRIDLIEKLRLFDQLAIHLEFNEFERYTVGYAIQEGGVAKIMGREYGTTIKLDGGALKEALNKFKKEGNQNDSN